MSHQVSESKALAPNRCPVERLRVEVEALWEEVKELRAQMGLLMRERRQGR